MSWGIKGKQHLPMGSSAERLPAGIYSYQENPFIGPYFESIEVKTDELLDVPGTAVDAVVQDIRDFLARRADYERYGFTHKRGILMYGPPGTGKSSIVQLAASKVVKDGGVVVMLDEPGELPGTVKLLSDKEPGRAIMAVMEDPYEPSLDDPRVLAVLDGAKSVPGLITLVTTNHANKLPPRLANRPGRFDQLILIDRVPAVVQLAYLKKVESRQEGPSVAQAIVSAMEGLPVTLAHLKEAFLSHVVLGKTLADIRKRYDQMLAGVGTTY